MSSDIEPIELAFFRWAGVVIILLPYIYIKRKILFKMIKEHFFILAIFGALGIAGFNTFLYYGLQDTTATNALLINSSIPILIIVLNSILFKEKLSTIQFFGILLSTFGVIFLVVHGEFSRLLDLEFNKGDLWIIVSSFDWAFYSILLRFRPKEIGGFEFITAITMIGFVLLAAGYIIFGYGFDHRVLEFETNVYWGTLYMVIFPSLLSFLFWNAGVEKIGANKTGQFTHLMPIFGAILAYLILDERLYSYHYYGIIFIGLGLYLSLVVKRVKS